MIVPERCDWCKGFSSEIAWEKLKNDRLEEPSEIVHTGPGEGQR